MAEHLAVWLRGATKHFGSGSGRVTILDNLDMSVPTGSIYALLGASGCGKTTLLNCVVGRLKLNKGEICVLGGKPGTKGSGVPGPRIGFMPQELALMPLFTIKETIFYFGWLFGMAKESLEERYEQLSKLLQLPQEDQLIKHLSGGQQRRVSFAAALVNNAELLILDEPTVGLDPLLRDLIWQHLTTITRDHKITIIITTHYIEEARQAHMIGLARMGKLLTEDSPERLLNRYKCSTLEAVFLKLSIRQSQGTSTMELCAEQDVPADNTFSNEPLECASEDPSPTCSFNEPREFNVQEYHTSRFYRIKPLLYKNVLGFLRSSGEITQAFILTVLIFVLFFYSIGRYPEDLKLAVVNEELGPYSHCNDYMKHENAGVTLMDQDRCELSGVSCIFLSLLNDSIATQVYYSDEQAGLDAVNSGKAYGLLYFAANYSRDLQEREDKGRSTTPDVMNGSVLQVFMSRHHPHVYYMLQLKLFDLYLLLANNLTVGCNKTFRSAEIPIKFHEPVFGDKHPSLQSYAAPRALIAIIFMAATTITSTALVGDRISGIWNRNIVAGVTLTEIVVTHLFFQMTLALLYTAETVIVMFLIFGEKCSGDIFTMFLLVYLQSVCGVCLGLVISVISKDYIVATFLTVGTFIPVLCFIGIIWPIEGMYFLLRYPSLAMPITISTMSLNHILQRGWSILQPGVYGGFLITLGWIAIFLVFSIIVLRIRGC